jgi:hypothetical protein
MQTKTQEQPACADCGARPAPMVLDDGPPLCDLCFDARFSAITASPLFPIPPAHETIAGSDGRHHRIFYRVERLPVGISVEAMEGEDRCDGYYAEVLGPEDADVTELVARVRASIRERIAHLDLERTPGGNWIIADWDLRGRLDWNKDGEPYDVVVDGRRLTWEEFGRALEPYEGWEFRMSFREDSLVDLPDEAAEDLAAEEPAADLPSAKPTLSFVPPNRRVH